MATIPVVLKHGADRLDFLLRPAEQNSAEAMLADVAALTEVPVHRLKVLLRGGMLGPGTDMEKLYATTKPGQVLGQKEDLPPPPKKGVVFIEDLNDDELAQITQSPPGFVNEGNTCYLNATLQSLRAIPELQTALTALPSPSASNTQSTASSTPASTPAQAKLSAEVKRLWSQLEQKQDSVFPGQLIAALRTLNPQFAEKDSTGQFAQQDAEEAWVCILQALKSSLLPPSGSSSGSSENDFVSRFLQGKFKKTMRCLESDQESARSESESFLHLNCHISSETNFLSSGLEEGLKAEILPRQSEILGRTAQFEVESKIDRLPGYLAVHMQRFSWRREINAKAKIMRRVKFPQELDVTSLLTPELKAKITPLSDKLKGISKDRAARAQVRRRMKQPFESSNASGEPAAKQEGELESEDVMRGREATELRALMHADIKADEGANSSGLYELNAIVSHKGAYADGGHYIGWVRQDVHDSDTDSPTPQWYKFDDDKVSLVPEEKITSLEGGGEDSVAYLLLYRSKSLD